MSIEEIMLFRLIGGTMVAGVILFLICYYVYLTFKKSKQQNNNK